MPTMLYKILSGQRAAFGRMPAGLTTLSLSWLNGRYRAVSVHKGAIENTWEKPESVDDVTQFGALVKEAVARTGYRGSNVSVVLAHSRLGQQLVEAPPAAGAALDRVIKRLVQRQKTFEGEAAWAYQPTLATKSSPSVLLHLFPKLLLDHMVRGCEKAGQHLVSVVPASAVLHTQLIQLPMAEEEVALVAASTGEMTTAIVGRRDGQLLLGRTFAGTWDSNLGNCAVDLNRTLLFVNQQFSVQVSGVWLFGPGAKERLPELQAQLQVPVQLSPVPDDAFYWAQDVLRLPPELSPNLITAEQRQEPQRRALLKLTTVVTGALVLGALAIAIWFHALVHEERKGITDLRSRIAELQEKHKRSQQQQLEFIQKQEVVRVLNNEVLPPIPTWFLGYLSEAVPPELVLTNLHVSRQDELWRVELRGRLQPVTNAPPDIVLSNALKTFTGRLTGAPFYMALTAVSTGTAESAAARGRGPTSLASWAMRLTAGPAQPSASPRQFSVEGLIQ